MRNENGAFRGRNGAEFRGSIPAVKRGAGPHSRGPRDSHRRSVPLFALLALVLAGARTARAGDEPRSFVLTFSNPGARSLAFGGAFAPLADDATAAYANPAGLVQLVRPEVSLEARVSGSLEDDGSGETTVSRANGVSFFSVVYPMQRLSLALYGQQLAGVDVEVADEKASGRTGWTGRRAPAGERLSGLEVWRVGISGAFRVHDNLSLGLGVSYFDGTVELAPSGGPSASGRSVDSNDWTFNAGALWNPSEQVRLGAFYRQGPSLSLGTPRDALCGGAECPESSLRLPDTFGVGAALRSLRRRAHGGVRVGPRPLLEPRRGPLRRGVRLRPTSPSRTRTSSTSAPSTRSCASTRCWRCASARGSTPTTASAAIRRTRRTSARAGGRSDEVHGTLGFGMAFRRFQFDLAVDGSRSQVTSSISGIFSF